MFNFVIFSTCIKLAVTPERMAHMSSTSRTMGISFFGFFNSRIKGLPLPSILTSISSLPAPWNFEEFAFDCFINSGLMISSTLVGYCFPENWHSSHPFPKQFLQSQWVCGIPLRNLLYLPNMNRDLIISSIEKFYKKTYFSIRNSFNKKKIITNLLSGEEMNPNYSLYLIDDLFKVIK